jgi:hypothetical protein
MPIVTEAEEQARRRKLWPLWLALGLVLLFLSVALVAPAVRPVEVSIGGRRFRVEVGGVDPAFNLSFDPIPGFQRFELNCLDEGPLGWWPLRVGRYYYRVWYSFSGSGWDEVSSESISPPRRLSPLLDRWITR